jgi:hypothetical protein
MDSAWIGVVGTLAGGFLVGIFALISKWFDKAINEKAVRRAKLEEIFKLTFDYVKEIVDAFDAIRFAPSHKVGPMEVFAAIRDRVNFPLIKILGLQRLYADELNPEFERVMSLAGEFTNVANAYATSGYKDSELLQGSFDQFQDSVDDALNALQDYVFSKSLIPGQKWSTRIKATLRHARKRPEKRKELQKKNAN